MRNTPAATALYCVVAGTHTPPVVLASSAAHDGEHALYLAPGTCSSCR